MRCAGVVLNGERSGRRLHNKRGHLAGDSGRSAAAIKDKNSQIAAGMAADFGGLRVAVSVNQKDTSVNKFYTNWRLSGSLPR